MTPPTLLDICCRVGGATKGYQRAGFRVTGVDIEDVPDYCGDDFVRGDGVAFLLEHGRKFDFIHMSWPCQAANPLTTGTNQGRTYPQLIPPGRAAAEATGRPWVIENTAGAPIRKDLTLNGDMFRGEDGEWLLQVWRPRYFELSGVTVPQPPGPRRPSRGRTRGWRHGVYYDGPYVAVYGDGGGKGSVSEWQAAMGIDWTSDKKNLAEAIPPLYSEYIGRHVLPQLGPALADEPAA